MLVAGSNRRDALPRGRDLPLADIQQHQDRLLGQEAEASDRLFLVRVELRVADRRALLQGSLEPDDHGLFALVRLLLGRRAVATALLQPLEAALDEGKIREDELGVEPIDVARRVDRALRMGIVGVVESAHDVEQRVAVAETGKVLGSQVLCSDVALARGGWRGQVHVGHIRLDDLFRLEDLGQLVESLVRDLHDADVELHPTEPAGLGVAPGERVEDGRLARSGKTDDGDLHDAMLSGIAAQATRPGRLPREASPRADPSQYPAVGSTTLSSGSPVA